MTWLPSLDLVVWQRRSVYVCFDSDYRTNRHVCSALHELAEELHRRGAVVYLVSLPDLEGLDKTGLDDFLVHVGASGADRLRQLLHEADPLGLTRVLWQLNDAYVYVRNPGLVLRRSDSGKLTPGAFCDHAEATTRYYEHRLRPDGGISYKPVAAASAWLTWPLRHEVQRLTYRPGQPALVATSDGDQLNLWPGWGVEPRAGDVEPFLRLVRHLFTGAEPEAQLWFLRWCAFPLQHPGTKLFSSVVVHGIKHGTGKSLIGYTLGRIYGKNFTEISQSDLHASFNEWAEGKQLVLGDDVTGSNKRADADLLKKLITQREIRINAKFIPTYTVPDCINYYFTSNHPDAFFLEDDDRRFFIHEVQVAPLDDEEYADYDLWLDAGGSAAVFDYLLHLDLGDFNPAGRAFSTAAKRRMREHLQSDLASWVRQLLVTPDQVLRVGEVALTRDLFTSRELLALYDPTGRTQTTANGVARELARAGARLVLDGQPLKNGDGAQATYFAVRQPERWLVASRTDLLAHLAGQATTSRAVKY